MAVILNHPPAARLQGHQESPVTNRHQCLHISEGEGGHVISDRYRRVGKASRQEMEGRFPRPPLKAEQQIYSSELWFVLQPHPSKWK